MLRSTIYLCAVVLMFSACGPQETRAPNPPTDPGHLQWSEVEVDEVANSELAKCEGDGGSHAECVNEAKDPAN